MGAPNERRQYLHVEVRDSLRARIINREMTPGAILPSEKSLTEEFRVSRSVIRQALRALASEGHIQVIPGRGAVVSSQPEWHRDAQRTAGLSAQMRALGTRVSTHVLRFEFEPASDRSRPLGDDEVLVLDRLRLLDGEPVAFIRTWLPRWVADEVSRDDLENSSLHLELHTRTGVSIHGGPRQIRAVGLTGDFAKRLGVVPGSPILLLEGESVDQNRNTIEIFSTWHRSDRIALDITELQPGNGDASNVSVGDDAALRRAEESAIETLRRIKALTNTEWD